MYTTHHPCWDAKNRHGLADELPFEFVQIAHLFSLHTENQSVVQSAPVPAAKDPTPPVQQEQPTETPKQNTTQGTTESAPNEKAEPEIEPKPAPTQEESRFYEINGQPTCPEIWEGIPRGLCEQMREANILPSEIQQAVAKRGYFPSDMPIHDYPIDFINGVLIGAWQQIRKFIEDDPDRLPF